MSIRQFHLSNYDMFSLLECIGIKNICVHLGIFTATCIKLVKGQWSDQSDHDTRIWYHRWAASKQSLQAPCLFFSPGPCLAHFACRFFISPHSTWVPVCRLLPHFHIGFKPMGTEYESMYYSVWDNKNHIIIREHPSLLKPQVWC